MTDDQLDALEAAAKAATRGPWTWNGLSVEADEFDLCSCVDWRSPINRNGQANACYIAAANPAAVLELIAELRQARAERDWIAGHCDGVPCNGASCPYPPSKEMGRCIRTPQRQCWLDAAKEATCPKN